MLHWRSRLTYVVIVVLAALSSLGGLGWTWD
jgi:hypothetical protein